MIEVTINKYEDVSSQIPFEIVILSLYNLVRLARWKKPKMDTRENKRKCNMVLPKLIGQERIIANLDP